MVKLGSAFLLIFISTQAISLPDLRTALRIGSELKPHHNEQKPMVAIIDPYQHYTEFLDQIRNNRGEERNEIEENDPKEEAKSLFYNYLRSSPEGNSNPEVENQKRFLREALRSRCNKVSSCTKKCPRKRPSCPKSCKEIFDSVNLCGQPKKKPKTVKVVYEYECGGSDECGKSYGKTMPPRWKKNH